MAYCRFVKTDDKSSQRKLEVSISKISEEKWTFYIKDRSLQFLVVEDGRSSFYLEERLHTIAEVKMNHFPWAAGTGKSKQSETVRFYTNESSTMFCMLYSSVSSEIIRFCFHLAFYTNVDFLDSERWLRHVNKFAFIFQLAGNPADLAVNRLSSSL